MTKRIVAQTAAAFACALMLSPVAPARADDGQAATSASGHQGLFNLINGETLCQGEWAFSTYYNKWDRRVQSDPATLAVDPLWTDWDMDVERLSAAVGYGLTDRIELALMLPYYSFDAEDIDGDMAQKGRLNGRFFEGRLDQQGLGNLRFGAKFRLSEGDTWNTALNAFVDLPTGDDDESVVTGDTGLGVGFAASNDSWVFNAGYFTPGDSDFGDVSDEVHLGLGYGHTVNERLEWITELAGIVYTDSNGEHDAADILSGVRYHLSNPDWALNGGLRVDLSDLSFDYTPIGGMIGLSYAPKNRYMLSVTKDGSGTGTVVVADDMGMGYTCGAECAGEFHCGAAVALTATADAGSRFDGWSGDCAGVDSSNTLTLDDDKACTATFVRLHELTVDIVGPGTVKMAGPGMDETCDDECSNLFDSGTVVDLTAMPIGDANFTGWSVDCDGTAPGEEVMMDRDKTCVATFVEPEPECDVAMVGGDYAKCGRYSKRGEWNCDSPTFTMLVDGFAAGRYDVPGTQLPTDANEKKTPLCDLVNFLRVCPQFKACVAGRAVAGEPACAAEERAARIAGFLDAQSEYPFFEMIEGRVQMAPECAADAGTGRSVEVFLER